MKVNTNPQSMAAQRALRNNGLEKEKVLSQLSSGERIDHAAVDPAGLAISEKMKANIRSTAMAKRNVNDAISMIQTAEGSLDVMSSMSIRMRELALQTANDTLATTERKMVDLEFQQLKTEINRVISKTEFNGKKLLSGNTEGFDFQVGISAEKSNVLAYDVGSAVKNLSTLGISSNNVRSKVSSQNALSKMDGVLDKISKSRASLGSLSGRMDSSLQNLGISEENLSASNSQIRDTDIARAASDNVKLSIIRDAATATLAQSNQTPQNALKLIS
ncbi:MAG: flagellin FliC [Bacteriovoracaceae bacterium]|nr:flagellin FliC [Bacteriovoracaceae bacterium]